MVDTPQTREDFDNMTDEEFMKLDEENYSGNVPDGETSLTSEDLHAENQPPAEAVPANADDDLEPPADGGDDPDAQEPVAATPDPENPEGEDPNEPGADPMAGEGEQAPADPATSEKGEQPAANPEEKGKTPTAEVIPEKDGKGKETPAKAGYYKLPDGMDTSSMDAAVSFHKIMTTPFKADGKDFTVRSPEDAVRLMQQGVNYSRRMQEIKPMKALNRMLSDQGLNDTDKLNFLIDVSKGNKEAIAKLLKDHNIDPMDLDPDKETGYQANNYVGTTQDNEFRTALDTAISTPEGQALVSHIQKDWDPISKAKLRDNPAIVGNLTELKQSGVYDKVVAELEYQKSIGYLTNVPFLQAFDQVGEAMKKVGLFDSSDPAQNGTSMAPLQAGQPQAQPVASGARKAVAPKNPPPNPHLSSIPPAKQTGNTNPAPVNLDSLSDEEFLKMAPPE